MPRKFTTPLEKAHEEAETYSAGQPRPLGGYLLLMAAFAALIVATAGLVVATGRRFPPPVRTRDLLLFSVGTHKLARLVSKEPVTSPLRAPFARYAGTAGPSEVIEEVRRPNQLRHAIGELLTCPMCTGLWIATGFVIGTVFVPGLTRLVAAVLSVLAGSDFLHLLYARLQGSA